MLALSLSVPLCSQPCKKNNLKNKKCCSFSLSKKAEHNALKVEQALVYAKQQAFVATGDLVVLTSGVISGNSGGTNSMSIETVPK